MRYFKCYGKTDVQNFFDFLHEVTVTESFEIDLKYFLDKNVALSFKT